MKPTSIVDPLIVPPEADAKSITPSRPLGHATAETASVPSLVYATDNGASESANSTVENSPEVGS
jgi:hypothetical protein